MDQINQFFKQGVKKIITRHSSDGTVQGSESFSSSSHIARDICFVLDGVSRYMFNGKVYDAVPGTFFLIDSWESHAFGYRQEDHDLLHLWIQLNETEPQFSGNVFQVRANGFFDCKWSGLIAGQEYITILCRRWDALNRLNHASPETVIEYLQSPLEALLDEISFQLTHGKEKSEEKEDRVIKSLKRYIRMSNARDCSLERLEKFSGYSRYYLSHKFREYEGCTIGDYIDRVRILYTAAAFRQGLRQKEIAAELGFSSPSNFWIWLRKHKDEIESAKSAPVRQP